MRKGNQDTVSAFPLGKIWNSRSSHVVVAQLEARRGRAGNLSIRRVVVQEEAESVNHGG